MRNLPLLTVLLLAATARADFPADHWAWKPPVRPAIPAVRGEQPSNPIDAFVRSRLEAAGLSPAGPATREYLIRRVTFDLTGLPPTPEAVAAFVADRSPGAWARVVDRLLASPAYGERWGRHWLDLVRYADTNGFEFDEPRPDAWRFRDYVIRSLNADKPFDRFVREQLAGDEAYPGDFDARVATGFALLGPDMTDASDQAQRRHNTLTDATDTASLAFLGLTIGCARCHDHKFEPIPQTDYYRLQAFFAPAVFRRDLSVATPDEKAAHTSAERDYLRRTKVIRDGIAAVEGPVRTKLFETKLAGLSAEAQTAHRTAPDKRTGGQQELVAETEKKVAVPAAEIAKALKPEDRTRVAELKEKLKVFDASRPAPLPVAMGLVDHPGPTPKTRLLERGELANPAAEVQAGFPIVLTANKPTPAAIPQVAGSSGRRLALANWVASTNNSLTARVIVNRLWQGHFGRGIVATASEFGVHGEKPSHPELLDYLATELVASGWRLKAIHRLILLSDTYQQSTLGSEAARAKDPENRLFSRMNRHRLEGEAVRDALLFVSGRLNPAMGGPGVVLPDAAGVAGGSRAVAATPDPNAHVRRSVYLFSRRNLRQPFLEAFDLPDSNLSCPKRERSTTAPQALALLNAPEAVAAATGLADRVAREVLTPAGRIDRAYRLTLGRGPTPTETERATAFLAESSFAELCRGLLNLNEFLYVD